MAVRAGRVIAGPTRSAVERAGARLRRTPHGALIGASVGAGVPAGGIAALFDLPLPMAALVLGSTVGVAFVALWYLRTVARRVAALHASAAELRDERAALVASAATVAHDLRSPLVTVHSYLDLLAEEAFGPMSADARRAAERAAHAARRAQSMVEAMLRRHALELAARPVELAPARQVVDLDEVLIDVVDSLEEEMAAVGVDIDVIELPLVSGDETALYRVFVNLLQNAVKYARPGTPPRILVSGTRSGELCEIAVRDWGIGIAPEDRDRIFEPLARGGGAEQQPGSGYGLATVRELVMEQGGRVWVDPDITDGACIRIVLPAG